MTHAFKPQSQGLTHFKFQTLFFWCEHSTNSGLETTFKIMELSLSGIFLFSKNTNVKLGVREFSKSIVEGEVSKHTTTNTHV